MIGLASCEPDYQVVSTKVVRGKISAIDEHHYKYSIWYNVFVQGPRDIVEIELPVGENPKDYKVGDSITLFVQQVKVKK